MITKRRELLGLAPAAIALAIGPAAFATVYQSDDAALRSLFSQADAFEPTAITLTDAQRAAIAQAMAQAGGTQAAHGQLRAWTVRRQGQVLGHAFIDQVVGRQDFITYGVGIDAAGKLRPVQILEYRESHGGEIRNPRWLAQFEGRASVDALRFGRDIKNIAGATLSSEHVTGGVRRIFAIWQAAFAPAVVR
jgi:Na+-translocating ferredoxin:NAD+ oxidoreductase RnfG subunit